jgi:hypothetical protein
MTRFPLRSKEGFRIGALAGLITFGMMVVIGAIAMTALSVKGELRQTLLEAANRVHTINPDLSPDQLVNYMLTPAGMTVGIVFTGLVLVVLAGFGGLISTLVSGRRLPR